MATRTLILSPRYTTDSRALRAAAVQAGWNVERLGNWRAPEHLRGREVALYGEPLFVEVIAAGLSLAMLDVPDAWLPQLPLHHRQRSIELTTLGEARGLTQPRFIKPADGRKSFEGRVYTSGAELLSSEALPDETLVLIAEPVIWEIEFRCFVLERQVATLSPYVRGGELALTEDGNWYASSAEYEQAQTYIETLLADPNVPLPPAIVLDIGKIRDRGWAVVEANTAWGAGIYGCDPTCVLSVLARACIKRDQLIDDDAVWAIKKVEVI